MHDLHKPYPMGPPSKDQRCAHVDDEHSTNERVSCNKMFPRKLIHPGCEEVAEDPRRRDLYRLWMARNCHFLNNFVPLVLLATLSNMDFQATLSKDAVIEYMTKHMTKSGQGALIKMMEHSFALCIEKARENKQGTGSAVLRWFNMQSISEVKSQLECMHLIFGAPRFICSREFRHLYLKAETRQAKTKETLLEEGNASAKIVEKSQAEQYVTRHEWEVPSDATLRKHHPLNGQPLWQFLLRRVGAPVSDSAEFLETRTLVHNRWQDFLELTSWWELKRYFNRHGKTVVLKPMADVVVVHPVGRFAQARTDKQWADACFWTLLAYCNHGESCGQTFRDGDHLSSMGPEAIAAIAERFVTASPSERSDARVAPCPPHVAKAWHLGAARRRAAEARKCTVAQVTSSLTQTRYVFVEEDSRWQEVAWADMSADEQAEAKEAWRQAEIPQVPSGEGEQDAEARIDKAIVEFMTKQMRWTHRDLHDALLAAGVAVPPSPSMRNYLSCLHAQYGDADTGFLPQSFSTHAIAKLKEILRILARGGAKLGGTMRDRKHVLAQRLAHWLNRAIDAGRAAPGSASEAEEGAAEADFDERPRPRRASLVEHAAGTGEIPDTGVVTAEQAESALGRTLATELDQDMFDTIDADTKEEEEALAGRQVNPAEVDYSCICWQPGAPDSVSAVAVGWDADLGTRVLNREDFSCTASRISSAFQAGLAAMCHSFRADLQTSRDQSDFASRTASLDPTQKFVVDALKEWAEKRVQWRSTPGRASPCAPPALRLLLLGTAGTGKTHTANVGITEVRLLLHSYDSVLTMAFTGVAAANLGTGSRTIDSVFHTNRADAVEDLTGDALDTLVSDLESVELLVIDEISTCGAAALEVVSRRMQQVARVLWRRRLRCPPPDEMGPFGGIGVLLMGDFAQLPPVLSTSLMAGMPLIESGGAAARSMALAGRQVFNAFEDVIRLRRIYRQKGVDTFKDSTMRLRDAAITTEDYALWKTHEVDDVSPEAQCPWVGGEHLLREAVLLVPENAPAGKINGNQLAARAPLHGEPGPASSDHVVVRCEARHSHGRGETRKADEFRNVHKASHLCVGARVMLTQNRLWGVGTVPLGLMNGARVVVVAILYAAPGAQRVDGSALAGTGFPSARPGNYPRGLEACPLPDFVVVHFPHYAGPPCFDNLPKTWVPVPCVEVMHKNTKSGTVRVGVPLRLAWALTIHKSQGITAREGCVVSFAGARSSASVSKLGLAFVAWTRAQCWEHMAFHKLPPIEDFVAARLTRDFEARSAFEAKADVLFTEYLERRGTTPEALLRAHEEHFKQATRTAEQREPSDIELADLRAMLAVTGVAPVSDSVATYCAEKSGRKGVGLWSFVASFRAEKKGKAKEREPKEGPSEVGDTSAARPCQSPAPPRALVATGASAEAPTQSGGDVATQRDIIRSEDFAAQAMQDMGFQADDIARALENASFSFGKALLLLLNGIDDKRAKQDNKLRFRRHHADRVKSIDCQKLAGLSVFAQYRQRAYDHYQINVTVCDFGQYAGRTSGACFWLCLAAGLAESSDGVLSQVLPGDHPVCLSLARLRARGVQACAAPNPRHTDLGVCAEALRTYFCGGETAAMTRPDLMAKIFPAFAGIDVRGPARTDALYRKWVRKLSFSEFGDELVVMAVALELRIRICCIPHTPESAVSPWAPSTYGTPPLPGGVGDIIYVGNNDVHYVYLSLRG